MTVIGREVYLLGGLLGILALRPMIAETGSVTRVLVEFALVGFFASVTHLIFRRPRERRVGIGLLVGVLATSLGETVLPARFAPPLDFAFHGAMMTFAGLAVFVILRDVFERRAVRTGDILAVVSGYLFVGLVWGNLYALVYMVLPGAFSVDATIAWQLDEWHLRRALFDHVSFMTLSTLGYPYVTPAKPFAETLSWMEVVFGQFYMAVVVAQLVGMRLARAMRTMGPDEP